MTAAWFEVGRHRDHLGGGRYRLRDAWADYCQLDEVINIEFAGTDPVERRRAVVTGHTPDGSAVVVPLDPPLAVVGDIGRRTSTPNVVTPLPTRAASGSATGGEAS